MESGGGGCLNTNMARDGWGRAATAATVSAAWPECLCGIVLKVLWSCFWRPLFSRLFSKHVHKMTSLTGSVPRDLHHKSVFARNPYYTRSEPSSEEIILVPVNLKKIFISWHQEMRYMMIWHRVYEEPKAPSTKAGAGVATQWLSELLAFTVKRQSPQAMWVITPGTDCADMEAWATTLHTWPQSM